MKNVFGVILFLSFTFGFGQEKTIAKHEVSSINDVIVSAKDSVEVKSEPFEGFKKFYSNLQNTIAVPDSVPGGTYKTRVSFIVDKDGTLTEFKIVQETPSSIGLGEEVIRVLKTFPNWKPNTKKTYYLLPVTTVVENDPEPELKKE